jgi:DNA-directed RNA polymerase specialized sigma24 family protein
MAELTQEVIDVVEAANWPEDVRQDFYVKWLENEEEPTFTSVNQIKAYCGSFLNYMKSNADRVDRNRARLLQENAVHLEADLHVRQDVGADPMDLMIAEESIGIKLDSLSAVLKDTLTKHYVEGRSPEDIAEANDENVEAVRKRITRARNILKGEELCQTDQH